MVDAAQHSGDDQKTQVLDNATLEVLAGKICASAAQQAQASCRLLELIGAFDAGGGLGYVRNAKSMAHWVSWSCSMAPGVAREHVRVARAMRQMPTVTTAFREGALSYSKVREATRVVGLVDEARLCELARAATASQLARTISGFRAASGTRIGQQERRRFGLADGGADQMTGVSGRLPAEEAGILSAALRAARDLNAPAPSPTCTDHGHEQDAQPSPAHGTDSATPPYNDLDALLDICRHYLATAAPEDESGEDRHLVVVDVAAEQLAAEPVTSPRHTDDSLVDACGENVSAGTSETFDDAPADRMPDADRTAAEWTPEPSEHVPAETSGRFRSWVCSVRGRGGIEPATAARLTCTGTLLGAVVDTHGDVLALGRSRRLVSKTQRRALMVRERMCQFPGCAQQRHLEAHHITPWSQGGRTDLDQLLLLCRFHHLAVHEGGITISRGGPASVWEFTLPDGETLSADGTRGLSPRSSDRLLSRLTRSQTSQVRRIRSLGDPRARVIRSEQTGERFDLHEAVQALFRMTPPVAEPAA